MPVDHQSLARVPLLSGLDDRQIKRLAQNMKERAVEAGRPIVEEGRGGIAFFILLDGEAAVTVHGEDRRTLTAGDYLGEMSLIDPNADRSASVVASTDVKLASMSAWDFKPFVLEHPEIAWQMLEVMARRVRDAESRS
jgi:CRP/FNR family transcriptional regulator, cyclic AMP receptor protein